MLLNTSPSFFVLRASDLRLNGRWVRSRPPHYRSVG